MTIVVTVSLSLAPLEAAAAANDDRQASTAAAKKRLGIIRTHGLNCAAILPRNSAALLRFRWRDLRRELALRPIADAYAYFLPLLQFAHA